MRKAVFIFALVALIRPTSAQQVCDSLPVVSGELFEGAFPEGYFMILPRTGQSCNGTVNNISKPIILVQSFDFLEQMWLYDPYPYTAARDLAFNYAPITSYLRSIGYDVILLRFGSPNAKIQANALLLRALIETVNTVKLNPSEPLIVAGHGLGGIVSRYCLAKMEEEGTAHEARLFISLDAPHQGMYIPLSVQFFLAALSGNPIFMASQTNFDYLQAAKNIYDSDVAKQLLKFQMVTGADLSISVTHSDFMDEMNSLNDCNGYPKNCRNVAVSFGSWESDHVNGVFHPQRDLNGNNMNPGALALTVNMTCPDDLNPFGTDIQILFSTLSPSLPLDCPYCPNEFQILNFLFFQNHLLFSAQKEAYTEGSMIEVAPGSSFDYYRLIHKVLQSYSTTLCTDLIIDRSCHIPTVSALDYHSSSYFADIKGNPYRLNNTPFDNILGFDENHHHLGNDLGTIDFIELKDFFEGELSNDLGFSCGQLERDVSGTSVGSGVTLVESEVETILAGNYTVVNGANVSFKAGGRVEMNDGFVAEEGSSFVAEIVPCSSKPCNWTPSEEPVFRLGDSGSEIQMIEVSEDILVGDSQSSKVISDIPEAVISPNPTTGILDLSHPQQILQLEVFDAVGRSIQQTMPNANTATIDLSGNAAGIYTIRATLEDGKSETHRAVLSPQ